MMGNFNNDGSTRIRILGDPFSIAKGDVTGSTSIMKFARATGITSTEEVVDGLTGAYTGFLSVASTIRVKAGGDAADDSAGLGAQTILVQGLDADLNLVEESITLAGASASASTTLTFFRVYRAYVTSCGAYSDGLTGGNTGLITLETTGGIAITGIRAAMGSTQTSIMCIPTGYSGYLSDLDISAGADTTFRILTRPNANVTTGTISSRRIVEEMNNIKIRANSFYSGFIKFPAKSDIWITAEKEGTGNTTVTCAYSLILIAE